jgi:uncharacterized protein YoxC
MPLLLEICFVIVTIAVVAIAIATVRALSRVGKTTEKVNELTEEVRGWVAQLKHVTSGAEELVVSVKEVAILEEVERPVLTAVAVARGVRTGTAHFFERITNRFHRGSAATNGGYADE